MMIRPLQCAALAAAIVLPALAAAQTQDSKEALRRSISASLTALIGDNSRAVVDKLMEVKPDGAISKNFDLAKVVPALFGRNVPSAAPDCQATSTAAREPDAGLCVLESGNRNSETGAYIQLAYSRNIGLGDVHFARRAAFKPDSDTLPTPVKLSDAQAYESALKFLDLLGVPRSEVPALPTGARLPVRSLVVGAVDEQGRKIDPVAIQKVVTIPRAFVVPGGLLRGPNGQMLGHVLAPGGATIAVNDANVAYARVDGWSDAQMDPKLDPRMSKTTAALADEITEDLYSEGVRAVGSLSILIALRKAYPNPEDPNPPLCPVCGLLLPAVKVIISQRGIGAVDSSEKSWVAPGLVREYDLVAPAEQAPVR